ncbi:MAG TPA: glycerol kinase, partial [Armatimonadota bacterium]|nr:glycerol kinase [Armatimonadota bacterium]
TALGAAYLAGVGCGMWTSDDLARLWKADRVFEPRMSEDQRQSLRAGWRRAVERARDWAEA